MYDIHTRTRNFGKICTTLPQYPGYGYSIFILPPPKFVRMRARACAYTRPPHRRGVGERPHVRGSVERTASQAVAKTRCRGGQTRWPWRAEWPLQGIPSEKAASGGCGPISTNHVALFGLSCTRFYPAPCFGHIPTRYTLFWPPPIFIKRKDRYDRMMLVQLTKLTPVYI